MAEQKQMHTAPGWRFVRPEGEPPFWMRKALPGEIDGFDPLTGAIIAHTEEERDRLSPASIADDFSCDPRRWSFDKLARERRNGMPAVVAEWERRATGAEG